MRSLVLITGAATGVGLASTTACAEAGFGVVATVRDLDRAHELEEAVAAHRHEVFIEQLDVTSAGVGEKLRELVLKYGPIDGLVNNAATAVGGVFEEQSERDIRDQFETNVFGAMEVMRALLPAMRASGRGRIINVSTICGRMGLPTLAPFAATEHALAGFSDALRHELEPFGIAVCMVEDGTLKDPISFSNPRRAALLDERGPYAALTRAMQKLLVEGARTAPGADLVAARVVELLRMPSPPLHSVVGGEARAIVALRHMMPDSLFATGLRRLIGLR